MANQNEDRTIEAIFRVSYPVKVCGLAFYGIILFTLYWVREGGISINFWILATALYCFVYPHVVYYLIKRYNHQKTVEIASQYFDAIVIGIIISHLGYPLLFVAYSIAFYTLSSISFHGFWSYFWGFVTLIISAYLMSSYDFVFNPTTGVMTDYLCLVGLVLYGWYIGYSIWAKTTQLRLARKRTKAAIKEATNMVEVVRTASKTLEIDAVMESIIKALGEVFYFETVSIQLPDFDHKQLVFYSTYSRYTSKSYSDSLKQVKVSLEDIDSLTAKVFLTLETHYVPTVSPKGGMYAVDRQVYGIKPFLSIILVPVVIGDSAKGVISFYSHTKKFTLDEKTIELIEKYIAQISIVINNALLYDKSVKQQQAMLEQKSQLERLSKKLSRYLSSQIYDQIFFEKSSEVKAPQRKRLTIFFSDIQGFTSLTDRMESEVLTNMLNQYLNEMTMIAQELGGTVDKFIGDAILIFFGDPETQGEKQDAINCVYMALAMRDKLEQLRSQWSKEGISESLRVRVGINTGYCTVGNFGSENQMDYTIVGSDVNIAIQLQDIVKEGDILISDQTYMLVRDDIYCEPRELITVKSRQSKLQTYSAVAPYEQMNKERESVKDEVAGFNIEVVPSKLFGTDKKEIESSLTTVLDRLTEKNKGIANVLGKVTESMFGKKQKE